MNSDPRESAKETLKRVRELIALHKESGMPLAILLAVEMAEIQAAQFRHLSCKVKAAHWQAAADELRSGLGEKGKAA